MIVRVVACFPCRFENVFILRKRLHPAYSVAPPSVFIFIFSLASVHERF